MTEFDQLCKILDEEFLASSQNLMIEDKGTTHKAQRVQIDGNERKNLVWRLYRFELGDKEFLPFFNKSDKSPDGLRRFCDYIVIAESKGQTYVLLIEMKRGGTDGADKQLRASEAFMKYLYLTAERLHKDFGAYDFKSKNVILRKIVLKEVKSNKTTTKGEGKVDKTQDVILYKTAGQFPISKFL